MNNTDAQLLESITHQLKLIANTNQSIRQWTNLEGENALMVRQYKHLKKELVIELDKLFKSLDISLQVIES